MVAEHAGLDLERIGNGEAGIAAFQQARVAHLAAGLGVEGRGVEHHHRVLAGRDRIDPRAVHIQRRDLGAGELQMVVALEARLRTFIGQAFGHLELAGGAGLLALVFHGGFEARHVDLDFAFAADVGREVDREAVGVVEREERVAVELAALGNVRQGHVQDLHAVFQRFAKTLFFLLEHLGHAFGSLGQLGIRRAHLLDQVGHQAMEEGLGLSQLVAVAQRAADDAAQDVAAAFVAGNDAVDDQERTGADMVGDDLERILGQILDLGFAGGGLDQILEKIDLVVRVHVLQHGGNALQAHAGVHAGLGQARHIAGGVALELHEHQVPDLDVAVAVFLGRPRGAAPDFRAVVVEDFRAGAARAGVGHLPEVVGRVARTLVVADADDALGRHADFLGPDVVGLVVFVIDGHPQLVLGQLVDPGQQFPGVVDGIFLEVVAEAEIAQHLEESVVACGVADVFQVVVLAAGAHAALRGRGARIRTRLRAEEHIFELHHSRIGEEQCRIVAGHKARRANDRMALRFEELEEFLADFGGFHSVRGTGLPVPWLLPAAS